MIVERLTKKIGDAVAFPTELVGATMTPDNAIMHSILTRLAAYEDTDLRPEDCTEYKRFEDELIRSGHSFQHVIDLLTAEKEGRLSVKKAYTDNCCGGCNHFLRECGKASGVCEVRRNKHYPKAGQPLYCYQSKKACTDFDERGDRQIRHQGE